MPLCPYGCGVNHRTAPTVSNCSKYPSGDSSVRGRNSKTTTSSVSSSRSRFSRDRTADQKEFLRQRRTSSVSSEEIKQAPSSENGSARLSDDDFYSEEHVFAYAENQGWEADYSTVDDGSITLYAPDYNDGEDDDLTDEEVAVKYSSMYDTDFGEDGIHIESIPKDSNEFDPNNRDTKLNGAGQRKIVGSKYAVMNFMSGAKYFEEGGVAPDHYRRQEP